MSSLLRLVVAIAALLPLVVWSSAGAQNCKDMPPGPAKKQCIEQKNPEAFQKCKDVPLGPAKKQCMQQNRPSAFEAKKLPDSIARLRSAAHTCSEMKAVCYQAMVYVSSMRTTLGAKQTDGGDPCERSFQSCMHDGTYYGEYGGKSYSGLERK